MLCLSVFVSVCLCLCLGGRRRTGEGRHRGTKVLFQGQVCTVGMALPKDDAAGNATWHPSQWEGWNDNESDEDIPQVCEMFFHTRGGGKGGGFELSQTDRHTDRHTHRRKHKHTHTHTHTHNYHVHRYTLIIHARPRARRKGLFFTHHALSHTHSLSHTHTSGTYTQAQPFKNPCTATSKAKKDFSSNDDNNLDLSGEEDEQEERVGSRGGGGGTEGDSSVERDSGKVYAYVWAKPRPNPTLNPNFTHT